jgi:DNA-binding response OmpR family regulator
VNVVTRDLVQFAYSRETHPAASCVSHSNTGWNTALTAQAGAGTRGVILLVEDDEPLRQSLGMLLRQESFEVHEAPYGADALALHESLANRLDVLITDYNLGLGITGTEVAEDLSRLLRYPIPTILMTGDTANCEIPMLANAPLWIARKPLDPNVLLAGLPAMVDFRRSMSRVIQRGI